MKPDAKYLRQMIMLKRKGQLNPDVELNCTIVVGSPRWYNKNGTIKKRDIANLEKFLIDSVMKDLDADDSQIFSITIKKVVSETEWFEIIIQEDEDLGKMSLLS